MTQEAYNKGLRCRGLCQHCKSNKENCYQYIMEVKGTEFDNIERMEVLSKQYKNSCNNESKKEITELIDNFIDDSSIEKQFKQKIIDTIVTLLTLK